MTDVELLLNKHFIVLEGDMCLLYLCNVIETKEHFYYLCATLFETLFVVQLTLFEQTYF